jgi:hypothetical protein
MIEYVELTVKLKIAGRPEPVDASLKLQPGYPLYAEAGELSILERELGLSVDSPDGQCLKLCLGELFSVDCLYSIRDVLLDRLKNLESVTRLV